MKSTKAKMNTCIETSDTVGTLDHRAANFLLGGARYQLAVRPGDAGFRVAWGINTKNSANPTEDLSRPFLWMGPSGPVEIESGFDRVTFRRPGYVMHVVRCGYGVGHVHVETTQPASLSFGPPGRHWDYGFVCNYPGLLYYPNPLGDNLTLDKPGRRWWSHGEEYHLCVAWGETVRIASTVAGLRLELPPGTHTLGFAIAPEHAVAGQEAQDARGRSFDELRRELAGTWQDLIRRAPLPKKAAWREKALETWYFLAHAARTEPNGCIKRRITAMSPMGYTSQQQVFHWDSTFISQALDMFEPDMAREMFRALFEHHQPGHPVNGCYGTAAPPKADSTQLPITTWAVLRHHLRWNDLAFVKEVYPVLHDDLWWWFAKRDVYGTGLPVSECGGYDNSVVFDTVRQYGMQLRTPLIAPDVVALAVREARAFALLAKQLGHSADAAQASRWADTAVNKARELLWDPVDQILYYHDGSKPLRVKAVYNLIGAPLLAKADAAAMLARYVRPGSPMWPGLFGATAASDAPGYDPNQFWRGPVWGGPIWLCTEMFCLAGFPEYARKAARTFLDAVARQAAFFEHYHPETGQGQRIPMILGLTGATFILMALEDYLAPEAYKTLRKI